MTASLIVAWYFPDQQRAEVVDFVTHEGEVSILIRETAAHMEIVDGGASLWRGIAGDFERLYLIERAKRIEMEDLLGWKEMATA